MSADHRRKASIWCAECKAFVEFEGWVYGDRKDSPVHITPRETAAHRAQHGVTA